MRRARVSIWELGVTSPWQGWAWGSWLARFRSIIIIIIIIAVVDRLYQFNWTQQVIKNWLEPQNYQCEIVDCPVAVVSLLRPCPWLPVWLSFRGFQYLREAGSKIPIVESFYLICVRLDFNL